MHRFSTMTKAWNIESLFNFFQDKYSNSNQSKVVESDDGEDLGKTKVLGGDSFTFSGQLYTGNNECQ